MDCKVDGCGREAKTTIGFCVMHYKRWKRNGSPDTVVRKYDKNFRCEYCGKESSRWSNGLCNACYVRYWKKGYVERDNAESGKGSINAGGYRLFRQNGEQVYEHRLIASQKIGRPLVPGEVVHHIDGDPLNNHPDNLEVFSDQSSHLRFHQTGRREE